MFGNIICPTAPMPAIFAPIFNTMAGAQNPTVPYKTHLG